MIAIVDSGGANLASVTHALRRIGAEGQLTRDPDVIRAAARVILPGVGAAADTMNRLQDQDLVEVLRGLTQPTLGICLGMQLLFETSQEGDVGCLGCIPGQVTAMQTPEDPPLPLPHMGWNRISISRPHPLLEGIPDGAHFYFVHSYRAPYGSHVVASAPYGEPVPAVVVHGNFMGTQFHPERSAAPGRRLLENFLRM